MVQGVLAGVALKPATWPKIIFKTKASSVFLANSPVLGGAVIGALGLYLAEFAPEADIALAIALDVAVGVVPAMHQAVVFELTVFPSVVLVANANGVLVAEPVVVAVVGAVHVYLGLQQGELTTLKIATADAK